MFSVEGDRDRQIEGQSPNVSFSYLSGLPEVDRLDCSQTRPNLFSAESARTELMWKIHISTTILTFAILFHLSLVLNEGEKYREKPPKEGDSYHLLHSSPTNFNEIYFGVAPVARALI
jgi:hypothetical protein